MKLISTTKTTECITCASNNKPYYETRFGEWVIHWRSTVTALQLGFTIGECNNSLDDYVLDLGFEYGEVYYRNIRVNRTTSRTIDGNVLLKWANSEVTFTYESTTKMSEQPAKFVFPKVKVKETPKIGKVNAIVIFKNAANETFANAKSSYEASFGEGSVEVSQEEVGEWIYAYYQSR